LKLNVNLLAIAGIVVGIISILSDWLVQISLSGNVGFNAIDLFNIPHQKDDVKIATLLFLSGTVLALITPMSGILQLTGVALYLSAAEAMPGHGVLDWVGIGLYLGIISAIILFASVVRPIRIGYDEKHPKLVSRILTFSKIERQA
jgi:hypothetical protein